MPSFLVNYGGPVKGITAQENKYQDIFDACEQKYHSKIKSTTFRRNGLDLTYYQVGIHRMIKVELPVGVELDLKSGDSELEAQARKTKQLFRTAHARAGDFNTRNYKLLGNNCVTAVSNVLNIVDESLLTGAMKIVPTSLDSNVSGVAKKDALIESMIKEGILGSVASTDDELDYESDNEWNESPTDDMAARVWRGAMSSGDELKTQAPPSADRWDESPTDDMAARVWNEAMSSGDELTKQAPPSVDDTQQAQANSSGNVHSQQAKMKEHVKTMRSSDEVDTDQSKPGL